MMDSKAKTGLRTEGKKILTLILTTLLVLFYAGSAGAATVMFISPNIDVPIRRGSSEKYKIIKIAKVNDQVELLEEKEDWSRVRFKDNTDGWLPKHLLTAEAPATKQLQGLLEQHKQLKQRNDELSMELSALQEHQNGEGEKITACIAELNTAKAERRAVEDTAKVMWFLAGSGVLLVGWLLGRMSGKPRRRGNSLSLH